MLQIAPKPDGQTGVTEDDALYCARCGRLVTRRRFARAADGAHEHALTNPSGRRFRVACYAEAPGVEAVGEATLEHTWFAGHAWRIVHCRDCQVHLGWRFESAASLFFGLIASRLSPTWG